MTTWVATNAHDSDETIRSQWQRKERMSAITTIQRRPIESLLPHPENARLGDVDAIKESIRVNGWHGVVVIQKGTHYILAGNHRTRAALELYRGNFPQGSDQTPADWELEKARLKTDLEQLPVHVLEVDEQTARRILLADNRTSDLATYNDVMLMALQASVVSLEQANEAARAVAASEISADGAREIHRIILSKVPKDALRGTGYSEKDAEQLSIAMGGGEAKEWGSEGVGQFQRQEGFATSPVRQLLLILSPEEYDAVIPRLAEIGDTFGLETNTDVLLCLIDMFDPEGDKDRYAPLAAQRRKEGVPA